MLLAAPLEAGTCFYIDTGKDFFAGRAMGICWVHENTGMHQEPSSKKVIQLQEEPTALPWMTFLCPNRYLRKIHVCLEADFCPITQFFLNDNFTLRGMNI